MAETEWSGRQGSSQIPGASVERKGGIPISMRPERSSGGWRSGGRISSRFGVRTFFGGPERGIFPERNILSLHGVSRHQDLKASATPSRRSITTDMEMIKEIGANTIRLAHHQHDQYFYDLCDEAGMIV